MASVSGKSIKRLLARSIKASRNQDYATVLQMTEEIIDRHPDHQRALALRFGALFSTKRSNEAREIGELTVQQNPSNRYVLNNQACLQLDARQPDPAIAHLESLIEQYGETAQWLYNLGLAYLQKAQWNKSISLFNKALDVQPDNHKALLQLANAHSSLGQYDRACVYLRRHRLLVTQTAKLAQRLIHQSAHSNQISAQELANQLKLWNDKYIPSGETYPIVKLENKSAYRIGFVVGDLPTGWWSDMVAPVVNQLSESDQLYVYQHGPEANFAGLNDKITRIKSSQLSDADFARQVRKDQIDILIDVCGMRSGTRQRAMGLILASRQYGWLAHEGAYASREIDLLDIKLGPRKFYVSPAKQKLDKLDPSQANTFYAVGCKRSVSAQVLDSWSEILRENSKWHIQLDADSIAIQQNLISHFLANGISPDRIQFSSNMNITEGDIVLDNFHSNDVRSVAACLFQKASVVSKQGELNPARLSAQLFQQLNIQEHLCANKHEYTKRATELAIQTKKRSHGYSRSKEFTELADLKGYCQHFRSTLLN